MIPCRHSRRVLPLALGGSLVFGLATVPAASAKPPTLAPAGTGERGAEVGSVPAVHWSPCRPARVQGLQCARYEVPLDYQHPQAGTVTLAVSRLRASGSGGRIGSLFLNPGGPGGSGADMVAGVATSPTFARLRTRFDFVGFDPRGTAGSRPTLACESLRRVNAEVGNALARPPLVAGRLTALRQAAQFDAACQQRSGRLLPFMGTAYVARDMDRLRAAVGDDKLSYFGFSYGTYLGNVYADIFPTRVRVAALDGALDPYSYAGDYLTLLRQNYRASENALRRFGSWCRTAPTCDFGGADPYSAFRRLVADLDLHPVSRRDPHGVTIRTTGYRIVFLTYLLITEGRDGWPSLGALLTATQQHRGLAFTLDPGAYLTDTAQNVTVECSDSAGSASVADYREHTVLSRALAPVFGTALSLGPPTYNGSNGAACALWPLRTPPSRWTGNYRASGAPPILVVGNTGDPSTPYSQAVQLASTLDRGALLTLVGEGHTSYGRSSCIDDRVDGYLLDLRVPRPGHGDRCIERPAPSPGRAGVGGTRSLVHR